MENKIENLIEMPPRSVCSADVCAVFILNPCAPCIFTRRAFRHHNKEFVNLEQIERPSRSPSRSVFQKYPPPQDVRPRCAQTMRSQSNIVSADVFRRFWEFWLLCNLLLRVYREKLEVWHVVFYASTMRATLAINPGASCLLPVVAWVILKEGKPG